MGTDLGATCNVHYCSVTSSHGFLQRAHFDLHFIPNRPRWLKKNHLFAFIETIRLSVSLIFCTCKNRLFGKSAAAGASIAIFNGITQPLVCRSNRPHRGFSPLPPWRNHHLIRRGNNRNGDGSSLGGLGAISEAKGEWKRECLLQTARLVL